MSDIKDAIEAMKIGGKRPRVHNAQLVTKLPQAMKDLVSEYAKAREVSDAAVTRDALAEYFERRGFSR